jgi:hypothetical protein
MNVEQIARLLVDRGASREIGPSGCWLLVTLATRGGGLWWDEELAAASGLGSRSSLARVRAECVLSGVLGYSAGAKGRPGLYTILLENEHNAVESRTNPDTIAVESRTNGEQTASESRQDVKRKRVTATPEDPPIPPELDTVEFREAWQSWILYRSSKRKAVTHRAAAQQLKTLGKWLAGGCRVRDLVASIEQSIANDWQGLFEPKATKGRSVVDREALEDFLEAGDGPRDVCEGDGVPPGGSAGVGGNRDPQRLLVPPAGFGRGLVPVGGGGGGGEPQIPHAPPSGGDQATRRPDQRGNRADVGGIFVGGGQGDQPGGGAIREPRRSASGDRDTTGASAADGGEVVDDFVPF